MINLRLDIYYMETHAQTYMRNLGIDYEVAVPQSIGDQWWFFDCKNVPSDLPDELSILDMKGRPLKSLIGYGLSQEMIDRLEQPE